jgi:pyruvate dehydrogenase E2 component (dihydrolipoamide acetyltransferase)
MRSINFQPQRPRRLPILNPVLHEFKMPDLATTGSAVKILRWLVKPGETITRGQLILEVETDKAAMEVESTASGILKETSAEEGQAVDAGTIIALIEAGGAATKSSAAPENSQAKSESKDLGTAPTTAAVAPQKTGGLFARNRAAHAHSDKGAENGKAAPKVEILESTPRQAQPARVPHVFAAPGAIQKLSVARRTAAKRLQESKGTIPHFYLQTSMNAEPMMAARKAALPHKLVWDAFFVKAVHAAVQRFDQIAYRFETDQLIHQNTDTIGVAVDISGDLFVVSVESPGEKSAEDISRHIRDRVAALQSGDPLARMIKPGIMSVTNLGGSNVESFTAIINPPESAILAIGKIRPVVIAVSESSFAIQYRANLTLSVDHRVVNGKYAADFLGAIVEELEKL